MTRLLPLLLLASSAHASEVPPLIRDVREVVRDVRRVLDREAPRHAVRDTGGECRALPMDEPGDDVLPTEAERVEVERHLASCSRASRRSDPWMVLALVRLERDMGVPPGLLSSAACWETGYTHGARGDWRDGHARSWGPLQMMGWWRAWCGWRPGARDDVEAAARCYLARVLHYLDDGLCPGNWTRAEAMAANGVRYRAWGCRARSRHAEELGRWVSAHWRVMEAAR